MKNVLELIRSRNIPDVAQMFLTRLYRAQGRSPHTIQAYSADLERYFTFLDKKELTFKTIKRGHLEDFGQSLVESQLAKRSAKRTLMAVRSFYKWLNITEEYPNPVRDWVESPKFPHKLPLPLS